MVSHRIISFQVYKFKKDFVNLFHKEFRESLSQNFMIWISRREAINMNFGELVKRQKQCFGVVTLTNFLTNLFCLTF